MQRNSVIDKIQEMRDHLNKVFNKVQSNLQTSSSNTNLKPEPFFSAQNANKENVAPKEPTTPLQKIKAFEESMADFSTQAKTGEKSAMPKNCLATSCSDLPKKHLTDTERSFFGKFGQNWKDRNPDFKLSLPKIRLVDKATDRVRTFPVYSESHALKLSRSFQAMLHKSTTDDDCETGEVQAKRATEFCRSEAEEAIEAKLEADSLMQKSPSSSEIESLETVKITLYKDDFERDRSSLKESESHIESVSSQSSKRSAKFSQFDD